MGIIEDIDKEVKKIKEDPDVNKFKKGLEEGINTFKEEWEKPVDKDSEIVDVEYTTKNPENETNSYNEPKFCPKCGANTKTNYKFCKNCGHQLITSKKDENKLKKDNNDLNTTNESKTEDSPKGFKIPISYKNSDTSEEHMEKGPEFTKQKNTSLNIDEDIKKENEESTISIDGNIEEEDANSYSVADEIYKFYELKEKGIITSEEFEKKKKQLLDL